VTRASYQDPRALGGGAGGKKRRADGDGRGSAPAPKRKLLPNKATRPKAPKQLRAQLAATPQNTLVPPHATT
jgi:hypothetical protein